MNDKKKPDPKIISIEEHNCIVAEFLEKESNLKAEFQKENSRLQKLIAKLESDNISKLNQRDALHDEELKAVKKAAIQFQFIDKNGNPV